MRDGIFKDDPPPVVWQAFWVECGNDAGWEEAGPIMAQRALLHDVRDGLEPTTLRKFAERTADRQRSLIETARELWAEAAGGRRATALEEKLLENLERGASRGRPKREHLVSALFEVLKETCEGHLRELRTHTVMREPRKFDTLLPRMRRILLELPLSEYACELLGGRYPKSPRVRGGLDLDKGLL